MIVNGRVTQQGPTPTLHLPLAKSDPQFISLAAQDRSAGLKQSCRTNSDKTQPHLFCQKIEELGSSDDPHTINYKSLAGSCADLMPGSPKSTFRAGNSEIFEFGNCFCRLQMFRTSFRTVHNRMAAIEAKCIINIIQPLVSGLITRV